MFKIYRTMPAALYSAIANLRSGLLLLLLYTLSGSLSGQQVDNKSCPDNFKRNNGNGQQVSVFAPNISTSSKYYLNALKSNNQGLLNFAWGAPISNPPVITRTWLTTDGVTRQDWSFGDNSSGTPFNPPGVPNGNEVRYNFYNKNLPTAGIITIQLEDPVTNTPYATCSYMLEGAVSNRVDNPFGGVSSGSTGGLESESLGTALAERIYNNSVQGVAENVNYSETPPMSDYARLRTDALGILGLMPEQKALGAGFVGYITSPNDILTFTNAVEVMSVDYVQGGINKAVAFCTKTLGGIYTHTKPVCDRLKGSELATIDTLRSGNYKFLLYNLKTASGTIEYAISFSAGFDGNESRYTLQSEWLTSSYQSQQNMFNFQLWSSDRDLLTKMLENVLEKMAQKNPIQQVGPVKVPKIYITKADRNPKNQLNLLLNIKNESATKSVTLVVSGKENEQSSQTVVREYPVVLNPFGNTTTELLMKDMAESEVHLFVNGVKEDVIYTSDGIWNIYKTPTTTINNYTVTNDNRQPLESEYRLFRNIKLEAVTSDYVTVYRVIKGGGISADISPYKFLKFRASGNSRLRIRLVSGSITNYDQQPEYSMQLNSQSTEYAIPLSEFKSAGSTSTSSLTDILTISFSYEVTAPGTLLRTELSHVRFGKNEESNEILASQMVAYPNPVRGPLNLAFESIENEYLELELVNTATGATVSLHKVGAIEGMNRFQMELNPAITPGLYIIRLQSDRQWFVSKVIIN